MGRREAGIPRIGYDAHGIAAHIGMLRRFIKVGEAPNHFSHRRSSMCWRNIGCRRRSSSSVPAPQSTRISSGLHKQLVLVSRTSW
ncbi:hypothetical protein AJ88_43285 [Mesorhizobium amorphae CCBAU 01583]|nr:hypothetical protein AJ88_43285 [Mesorhizobium amorphae CCBAU 01583]